ncbi:MAG: hypothetical protein L0K86_20400 [Actinomycetia bacterium]|nr:hypothetical protein [Actinomycetes bacterium]
MQQNSPVDPHEQLRRLWERVDRLERDRRHSAQFRGFGCVYAACAAALFVVSFLPLYGKTVDKEYDITRSYGSVWELLGEDTSGASAIGVLLILVLVGLLGSASFAQITETIGLPISITVIGVIIAGMVVAKPAIPDPQPAIAYGGQAGIAVVLIAAAMGAVHALLLVRSRSGIR